MKISQTSQTLKQNALISLKEKILFLLVKTLRKLVNGELEWAELNSLVGVRRGWVEARIYLTDYTKIVKSKNNMTVG